MEGRAREGLDAGTIVRPDHLTSARGSMQDARYGLRRRHLPGYARLEHEDDAGEGRPVGHTGPSTPRLGRLRRQQRFDDLPQLVRHQFFRHVEKRSIRSCGLERPQNFRKHWYQVRRCAEVYRTLAPTPVVVLSITERIARY